MQPPQPQSIARSISEWIQMGQSKRAVAVLDSYAQDNTARWASAMRNLVDIWTSQAAELEETLPPTFQVTRSWEADLATIRVDAKTATTFIFSACKAAAAHNIVLPAQRMLWNLIAKLDTCLFDRPQGHVLCSVLKSSQLAPQAPGPTEISQHPKHS